MAAVGLLAACSGAPEAQTGAAPAATSSAAPSGSTGPDGRPFVIEEIGELDEPWAMTFLPDGQSLITGRGGDLTLRSTDGRTTDVSGVPEVVHEGQGGLGDVIVAPDFASTRHVYLSWAEAGDGGSGAAVARATLAADGGAARLDDLTVIWQQQPKVSGNGHYGHRLAFSPDGEHLFVSSGERQKMEPAQDLQSHLGKIIRLDPTGPRPPTTRSPIAARSPPTCGATVTATRSGSPSTRTATCGTPRWVPRAATS